MQYANNEWLTTKQALNVLRITSRTTLYKYAMKFGIRVSKPIGKNYYNYHDLIKVIDSNSIEMGI